MKKRTTKPDTVLINIKTSADLRRRLKVVAKALEMPYTQLIKSTMVEKLDELENCNPRVKQALEALSA